jgi:hypothetical protein
MRRLLHVFYRRTVGGPPADEMPLRAAGVRAR